MKSKIKSKTITQIIEIPIYIPQVTFSVNGHTFCYGYKVTTDQ